MECLRVDYAFVKHELIFFGLLVGFREIFPLQLAQFCGGRELKFVLFLVFPVSKLR